MSVCETSKKSQQKITFQESEKFKKSESEKRRVYLTTRFNVKEFIQWFLAEYTCEIKAKYS